MVSLKSASSTRVLRLTSAGAWGDSNEGERDAHGCRGVGVLVAMTVARRWVARPMGESMPTNKSRPIDQRRSQRPIALQAGIRPPAIRLSGGCCSLRSFRRHCYIHRPIVLAVKVVPSGWVMMNSTGAAGEACTWPVNRNAQTSVRQRAATLINSHPIFIHVISPWRLEVSCPEVLII